MNAQTRKVFLLAVSTSVLVVLTASAQTQQMSTAVEQALLSEDWAKVLQLCGTSSQPSDTGTLRAIRGHACLALNRNDTSLEMFLSLKTDADRRHSWAWLP